MPDRFSARIGHNGGAQKWRAIIKRCPQAFSSRHPQQQTPVALPDETGIGVQLIGDLT